MNQIQKKPNEVARLEDYPGGLVMMRPLPIDRIIERLAGFIEGRSMKYMGFFHPNEPVLGMVICEAFYDLDRWSVESLRFGAWRYQLKAVYDSPSDRVTFEVMAERAMAPVKLCWCEWEIESFDADYANRNFASYSPVEIITNLQTMLVAANQNITEWNRICRKHKPFFDHALPVPNIMNECVRTLGRDIYNFDTDSTSTHLVVVHESLGSMGGVSFGDWEFGFDNRMTASISMIRSVLHCHGFDGVAFVLSEDFAYDNDGPEDFVTLSGAEEAVFSTLMTAEKNMEAWNRMLEMGEERILSGESIGT